MDKKFLMYFEGFPKTEKSLWAKYSILGKFVTYAHFHML